MDAIIMNYRGSRRTQYPNQMILQPADSSSKEDAQKLVGNPVEWTSPAGKKLQGKVSKPHGAKGAVLAQFNPGLPGQAIGTKAKIL